MITISEYPALKTILWEIHSKEISEKDAFLYYENRLARWFHKDEIEPKEFELIEKLTNQFGNGIPII